MGEGHGGAEAACLVGVDVGVERRCGGEPAEGGAKAEDVRLPAVGRREGRGDVAAAGNVGLAGEEEEEFGRCAYDEVNAALRDGASEESKVLAFLIV